MLYIMTPVWVLRTPNPGQHLLYYMVRVFTNFQKCYTRVCVNQGLGIKIYMAFLHQNLAKTCKTWKKEISTIVWSAQHPNMGQNLQKQSNTKIHYLYFLFLLSNKKLVLQFKRNYCYCSESRRVLFVQIDDST